MKFAHRYKLLKDFPGHAAGEEVSWRGDTQRFYFHEKKRGEFDLLRQDMEGPKFTVEQVQDKKWFKPLQPLRNFIPKFPDRKALDEYIYLTPDCRLVNDVDECRAINAMLDDKGFQDRLYEFYRIEYNTFHGLT